jgi:hypothetical protein
MYGTAARTIPATAAASSGRKSRTLNVMGADITWRPDGPPLN